MACWASRPTSSSSSCTTGWALAAVVTGVAFYLAPHTDLPAEANRELDRTPLQHLFGNTYVLVGLVALVALRLTVTHRREASTTSATATLDSQPRLDLPHSG